MIDIYNVTKKLIGRIKPQGETNGDQKVLVNIKDQIGLVDRLIIDLYDVYDINKDSYEYSRKICASTIKKFLIRIGN